MNTLETQLKKISRLIKNVQPTPIVEADILAYVEGRLGSTDKENFERYVLEQPQLADEIIQLKSLMSAESTLEVPPALHRKLISALGLRENYFMEIVLEKVRSTLDILSGATFYQPGLGQSLVPTRGGAGRLYVFQSNLTPYCISCRIQSEGDSQFLHFVVEDEEGQSVKNGRFSVSRSGEKLYEVVSDQTGTTPVKTLESGNYEIEFSIGRNNLGTVKLTIF